MTKNEFLQTLRGCLSDELPSDKVNENINYYDDYISQNVAKGKTEDEILDELGEPRLIAKTIIDTYKMTKSYQFNNDTHSRSFDDDMHYGNNNYQKTSNSANDEFDNRRNKIFNKIPWYQKILGILIIIIVLFVVITLGSVAIKLFFTFGIPILLMYLVYKVIFSLFNHR